MTEKQGIITALQNEIAAAQEKRADLGKLAHCLNEGGMGEYARLGGYIQGLNQALYLLTREPARELEY